LIRHDYPQKILKKISSKQTSAQANENYTEQTDIYTMYEFPKKIVMLGTSQTFRVNWTELLNRPDVANRGIEGDITAGFVGRMNFVLKLEPAICFVEGGINDLRTGVEERSVIGNLEKICDELSENGILTVVSTVAYVTKQFPGADKLNSSIRDLNTRIKKLASQKNAVLLDLNAVLSEDGFLNSRFAGSDGIHFNSQAYLIWKEEVLKILKEQKI
jgi:lysophospholipase L1-like esterase